MQTNVLITGGKGQLGQCLNAISSQFPQINFIFVDKQELDITNFEMVSEYFENHKIDWCVNCAAYTAVDKAEEHQELAQLINVQGTHNLAMACKASASKLVHVSTDFVFNGMKNMAYQENDATGPINVYGKTKLEGELEIQALLKSYFIIRTSWLYSEFGNNFLKTILRLASQKDKLDIVDNQIGTPTYAGDLAKFIVELIIMDSTKFGLYHFSNEGVASWYDFAKSLLELSHVHFEINPIPSIHFPTPAERPVFSVLDNTKIKDVFNVRPPYWRESLKKCISKLEFKNKISV